MQLAENAWNKGLEDAHSLFSQHSVDYVKGLADHTGTAIVNEARSFGRAAKKDYRKYKPTVTKDLHHLRKAGKKDLSSAETVIHGLYADADKKFHNGTQYTKQSLDRASRYIKGGLNAVRDDAGAIVRAPGQWLHNTENSIEGDLVTVAIIGGLLIYAFRDQIGTGVKYTARGLKSAGNFVYNEAKAAAPYAPLLLV